MRLPAAGIGRALVAGLVLFLLLAISLVGIFPSRATVVVLEYELPLALLLVLQHRVARTAPVWRREWGTTLAMWLTLAVTMLVVCGGVEGVIALTTVVLPWGLSKRYASALGKGASSLLWTSEQALRGLPCSTEPSSPASMCAS